MPQATSFIGKGNVDPERVRRDVARGYFTAEDAERDYGVVLGGEPAAVDEDATARLRRERRPTAR